MPKPLTTQTVSVALFGADPMHTCCRENDCFDEYDRVAEGVVERLEQGHPLKEAIHKELTEWFGQDLAQAANIQEVLDDLQREDGHDR